MQESRPALSPRVRIVAIFMLILFLMLLYVLVIEYLKGVS